MAKASVSEYSRMVRLNVDVPQIADESSLIAQYDVDFTAGEAHGVNLSNATTYVRVCADSVAAIKIGLTAVAAATDKRLPANVVEYFAVGTGVGQSWRFSAITRV